MADMNQLSWSMKALNPFPSRLTDDHHRRFISEALAEGVLARFLRLSCAMTDIAIKTTKHVKLKAIRCKQIKVQTYKAWRTRGTQYSV
jgi:hypothetical protein